MVFSTTFLFVIIRVFLSVIINVVIFVNAIFIQKLLFSSSSYQWHDHIVIFLLFVWAQIIVILLAIHQLRLITYRYVLIIACFISLVILLFAKITNKTFRWDHDWHAKLKWPPFERNIFLLGLGTLIAQTIINLITPAANWDSLNYQLYMPAFWYQQRQLAMVSLPYGDVAPPYYPMNANLFYLWLILPFDTIAVADIGQAPFALLTALSVYMIARQLDLSPVVARRAGILTLFVPMVSATAGLWSTNDVIFAAIWLLSLAMVQRAARTATLRDLVLASIALGLTIGTKGFALTFGILLAPWLAWAWWRYGCCSWQRLGLGAIAMIIPLGTLASFSYVRNWLLTGNPLYPYRFRFGWITLPGLVDRQLYTGHPFFQFDARLLFFEPGYANLGLLLLVAIPSLRKVLFHSHPWRRSTIILIGLAAGYFVLFSELLPIRATRFLLPAMLLLLIVAVIGLEQIDIHRLKERFYLAYVVIGSVLIFLITVFTMGTNLFDAAPTSCHIDAGTWRALRDITWQITLQTELQYLLLLGVSIGGLVLIRWALSRWGWRSLPFIGLAAIVAFATGLEHYDRREYYAYTRLPYANVGQLWRWVNEHTTGQRIAYLGGNIPLPLMGHHLKNVVTAVNVGAGDLLHEIETNIPADQPIHTYPDNRSDVPDQAGWLQQLRDKQIDLVVVYELIPVDWPEVQWMQHNPDQFELVYNGPGGSVWRVRR